VNPGRDDSERAQEDPDTMTTRTTPETTPEAPPTTRGTAPNSGPETATSPGSDAPPDAAGSDRVEAPRQLPAGDWKQVAVRVKDRAKADQVPLLSAGVAFYAMLALVPSLIAAVSAYGLVSDPDDVQRLVGDVASGLPSSAQDLLTDQLQRVVETSAAGLSVTVLIAIVVALWSASAGVRHLVEALNAAYGEEESRGMVAVRLNSLALTGAALLGAAITVGLITVLPRVLSGAGLGGVANTLLSIARWPVLAVLFLTALAAVYRFGPDRAEPDRKWVTWGAGVATAGWLVGSFLFGLYTQYAGSFAETYGSLAGVVVLLLWLQLTGAMVLIGALINHELGHEADVPIN